MIIHQTQTVALVWDMLSVREASCLFGPLLLQRNLCLSRVLLLQEIPVRGHRSVSERGHINQPPAQTHDPVCSLAFRRLLTPSPNSVPLATFRCFHRGILGPLVLAPRSPLSNTCFTRTLKRSLAPLCVSKTSSALSPKLQTGSGHRDSAAFNVAAVLIHYRR